MTEERPLQPPADSPPPPPARRQVAVALRHERGDPNLPRVVASGHGAVAEQILELAFAHGVKVRTDADLAEILAAVDVESEIPIEAIAAVAEILAHVYRANGTWNERASASGTEPAGALNLKPVDRPTTP
ncbi:flagellar protein FhlB [Niveispirillum lacus]|uniref:Flagellar protein FhlB n=1 Tax=Niveispirillum lacus TaxID=1981099 RepID=A0A255YU96_9PROT|nr:EscU/YscU/HrcU family type III secretion system export apparatus switch protein [Niveispirillum lacus]OYQ32782.1 flagellar protein FhlB [Niveispirillum lacus]